MASYEYDPSEIEVTWGGEATPPVPSESLIDAVTSTATNFATSLGFGGDKEGTGGGVTITGFADGTFIAIEFNSPQYNITKGLDGNVAFLPKHDLSGTCKVRLQQGSRGNQFLTAALSEQDRDVGSLVQGNLTITDASGAYNLEFNSAIISNQPSINYGMTASEGVREWVFYSPSITYVGNVAEVNRGESTLSQAVGFVSGLF